MHDQPTLPSPALAASLALALCGALAACRAASHAMTSSANPAATPSPWHDPTGSVHDPALAKVCRDAWEIGLADDPVSATYLDDPRYHGELPAPSPEQRALRRAHVAELLQRAGAIDPAHVDPSDRITWRGIL